MRGTTLPVQPVGLLSFEQGWLFGIRQLVEFVRAAMRNILSYVSIFALASVLTGCSIPDRNMAKMKTANTLQLYKKILSQVSFDEISSCNRISDFVKLAVDRRWIGYPYDNSSPLDGFDNHFVYHLSIEGDSCIVHVYSIGPNGVDENGDGDDLGISVTIRNVARQK